MIAVRGSMGIDYDPAHVGDEKDGRFTMAMFHTFLLLFVPLFVVIDVAGSVPVFLALTPGRTSGQRRAIAAKASAVAAVTGVLFIILGQAFLSFLSIQVEDFQIAGGLLLVILATLDLLSPGKPAVDTIHQDLLHDPSVVPLAVPLIVGPATMTTSLLLLNTFSPAYNNRFGHPVGTIITAVLVCAALLVNLALLFAALYFATELAELVGKNVMAVLNKIVMILLAAFAISLIRRGIVAIIIAARH
jgi:multiple antibiotic resistance protein